MQKGFVKIPRHFFETSFWNEKRKFSKTDALLDILQNTDYKHGVLRTSYRALADRWQWNLPAVQRYVKSIVKEGFVFVHSDTGGITFKSKCDTPSDTPSDTPKQPKTKAVSEIDDTPSDTPSDTPRAYKNDIFNHSIEEEKKPTTNVVGKEKTDVAPATTLSKGLSLEERQVKFYDTLRPYVTKYPAEMLRAFYDYWSEPNRSRTKFRQELEKTWDLPRRLATWNKREKERKFNNGKYHTTDSAAETVDAAAAAIAELIADNR